MQFSLPRWHHERFGYGTCSLCEHKIFWGSDMLDMTIEPTEAVLSELLSMCEDTAMMASQLAVQASEETLRILLHERAQSYTRAALELRRKGGISTADDDKALMHIEREGELSGLDSVWEAIECSALIGFRDALDAGLPPELHAAVRRWIGDGVSALERLRALTTAH